MDDLQDLRLELAELKREVASLKRTRWITPGSLAVALVSLVALGVASPRRQAAPQPAQDHTPTQLAQDISCKSLTVVDGNGNPMIRLKSDVDGGTFVINGADGKKRFFSAVENNAGFSDWYDAAGVRRATVFIGDQGAEFHLADQLEHIGTILQQGAKGGSVAINGPDGSSRLHAGIDNGGGYIDIFDQLGNRRETFYMSDKNTAQFKILGADQTDRFLASGEPKEGEVVSYGEDGKRVAEFPPKK